jgi:hypothetical protein
LPKNGPQKSETPKYTDTKLDEIDYVRRDAHYVKFCGDRIEGVRLVDEFNIACKIFRGFVSHHRLPRETANLDNLFVKSARSANSMSLWGRTDAKLYLGFRNPDYHIIFLEWAFTSHIVTHVNDLNDNK